MSRYWKFIGIIHKNAQRRFCILTLFYSVIYKCYCGHIVAVAKCKMLRESGFRPCIVSDTVKLEAAGIYHNGIASRDYITLVGMPYEVAVYVDQHLNTLNVSVVTVCGSKSEAYVVKGKNRLTVADIVDLFKCRSYNQLKIGLHGVVLIYHLRKS